MKRGANRSSQRNPLLWMLSVIIVASVVCSLLISVFPSPSAPAEESLPTLPPLWTPSPVPPTPTATATLEATPVVASTATPVPPEDSGLPWAFAVLGASQGLDLAARTALQAIEAEGVVFVLHGGNMTASGTQYEFEEWHNLLADLALPFYPTPGNLDNGDGALVAYLAFSGASAAHYSFDRGPLHVSVANASLGVLSEEELAWLAADLAATTKALRVVALHYPPFDPADGADVLAPGGEALMQMLASEEVDLVVIGHLPTARDEVRDGVRYVAPGALGARTDGAEEMGTPHYLRVTVSGTELFVEAVPVDVTAAP